MPVTSNQINLQTSFSKLAVLYYLLKVVKDNEPTTRAQTKNTLFPVARSKLKSTTTPWDPNKADTHARITLEEYGLIEYDPSDSERFSVSELGNKFLSSFNLVLNQVAGGLIDPEIISVVDPDEATYLIWQILCATHIVDSTYDIHPYRILMALLLRQELNGYVTKREWAHFLVNTAYDCDAKLGDIAASLRDFRTSTVLQDIKSTDRVLGRLKDWSVIELVSGTTGDLMAFKVNSSFKWVAYSNLTKKELAMNSNDLDVIKKLYEDWVQAQPSLRGGNVTLPAAQHYSYELEKDVDDPLFVSIPYSNLFQITDAVKFATVKTAIEAVQGFSNFDNTRGNGYFSRAMVLYDRFLNDPVANLEVKKMVNMFPYLAAIRTKPFILMAGISGTGKSRLVRQLAMGCCPEWADAAKTVKHPFADEQKPGNFELIAVRPNWHDSTELMGFESRIPEPTFVIKPFVEFLVKAWMNPDIPFFLCLDEMNLAPVEQYFAEYLSAIESRKEMTGGGRTFFKTDVMVKMGAPEKAWDPNGTTVLDEALKKLFVPYAALLADPNQKTWAEFVREMFVKDGGVSVPPNLVVMGTVNMDETTCSFSRKVLDRAMSFELNDVSDMYDKNNLAGEKDLEFGCLGQGVTTCTLLTGAKAYAADNATGDKILAYLKAVNDKMEGTPFKIAYRSRNEIMIYCLERVKGGIDLWKALDEATSMKILSRIEGDEQKFIHFKLRDFRDVVALELCKIDNPAATKTDADAFIADPQKGGKSISLAKLQHMAQALADGAGFVSFWE